MMTTSIIDFAKISRDISPGEYARSNFSLRAHNNKNSDDSDIKVEKGGTLTLTTSSQEFPDFEVEFRNCAPPNDSDELTGSVNKPVVLNMPLEEKTFQFCIVHKSKDGRCIRDTLRMAHSCGPCS
jgi:hypothetical protein